MALAMQIAALGRAARNASNIKLRQPLARALVFGDQVAQLGDLAGLVSDELNVKEVQSVAEEAQVVEYEIGLLPNVLGPKHGKRFPLIRRSVAALEPAEMARRFKAGLSVTLAPDDGGPEVELLPEEVEVRSRGRPGLALAEEKGLLVAVDVTLTPELAAEGLARDLVRRIQAMRKDAGLELSDRIVTYYETDRELDAVIRAWAVYIQAETLSLELTAGGVRSRASCSESFTLEGHAVTLGISKP
jgi:isoleucyl-tRNA synthetase